MAFLSLKVTAALSGGGIGGDEIAELLASLGIDLEVEHLHEADFPQSFQDSAGGQLAPGARVISAYPSRLKDGDRLDAHHGIATKGHSREASALIELSPPRILSANSSQVSTSPSRGTWKVTHRGGIDSSTACLNYLRLINQGLGRPHKASGKIENQKTCQNRMCSPGPRSASGTCLPACHTRKSDAGGFYFAGKNRFPSLLTRSHQRLDSAATDESGAPSGPRLGRSGGPASP